jgi:hypothetical protein
MQAARMEKLSILGEVMFLKDRVSQGPAIVNLRRCLDGGQTEVGNSVVERFEIAAA